MHILALSGSLRKASLNTQLLQVAKEVAPKGVTVNLYQGLGALPLFNPDLEDREPTQVLDFQKQLACSDAVLIASPEYAHGVTGVMKNALDWVVGSSEFSGKPVGVLNAAERAYHAWNALQETITTMDANLIPSACLIISLTGNTLTLEEMKQEPRITSPLNEAMEALGHAIKVTAS